MTALSEELLQVLTNEPQSKWLLAEKLNTNERTIRRCIKELRDNGYIIVSHSLNSGYRLGSEKDRDGMIREYESRIASMAATVKALKEGKDLGQMEMEEMKWDE